MTAEVSVGNGNSVRLIPHPLRAAILGELQARPFTPIATPRRILHFAFDTSGDTARHDRAALADFCARHQLELLKASAKQHRVAFGGVTLRWEQHSEFTTYTWELPSPDTTPFHPDAGSLAADDELASAGTAARRARFAPVGGEEEKTCNHEAIRSRQPGGSGKFRRCALFATDFQADATGFVHILVLTPSASAP